MFDCKSNYEMELDQDRYLLDLNMLIFYKNNISIILFNLYKINMLLKMNSVSIGIINIVYVIRNSIILALDLLLE